MHAFFVLDRMSVEFYRSRTHYLLNKKSRECFEIMLKQKECIGCVIKWDGAPMKVYIKRTLEISAEVVVTGINEIMRGLLYLFLLP